MAQSRSKSRQSEAASDIKKLIAAGAVAATLGGWAAFAAADAQTPAGAAGLPTAPITAAQAAPAVPTARVQTVDPFSGQQNSQAAPWAPSRPPAVARTRSSR